MTDKYITAKRHLGRERLHFFVDSVGLDIVVSFEHSSKLRPTLTVAHIVTCI